MAHLTPFRLSLAGASVLALFATATGFAQDGGAPAGRQSFEAQTIILDDVIGTVLLRTSDRSDISVTVDPGAGVLAMPSVADTAKGLEIKGARGYRHTSCRSRNGVTEIRLAGDGYHQLEEYPSVVIDAPEGVAVTLNGGVVFGELGALGPASIRVDSCGDVSVESVDGAASLVVNGSGDLAVGPTGSAKIVVNGSGDLALGAVSGDLDITLNGSGDIQVETVDGDVDAQVRGSGDIALETGRAEAFVANVYGSGDIRFGGVAVDPRVSIFGSGDISIRAFEGSMRSRGSGSGEVHTGD